MWHYKFKACVKIVLFVNIIIIIIFILTTIANLFNTTTPKLTKSNEAVSQFSENIERSTLDQDLIMRKFELKRDKDEREIYFKNLNSKYQQFINNNSVAFKQISFMPIPEEKTYNDVLFKHVHTNLQQKLVHLDLKGAPPKLKYLTSLLKDLQKAGATGLLIEYEDMFPYENNLEAIRAGNAYNKTELQTFLEIVKSYDFEVIPLVQTFGHLEYVLKLKEFRDLREIDSYPDSICPSQNRSFEVIVDIIDQIVNFHSDIMDLKWIHLGCDEVYHINKCPKCQHRNLTTRQLFVYHVTEIVSYVKMRYPHLTCLIWDDMLRGFQPLELKNSGLGHIVEPVVWIYTSSIKALVPNRVWYMYTKVFSGIWIASAFKGASGATNALPKLKKNYENHMAWLNFAKNYQVAGTHLGYNFKGIILTGWSRYEHFSVLCEMLPVSIPSLFLNLLLVNASLSKKNEISSDIHKYVFERWLDSINCFYKKGIFYRQNKNNNLNYLNEMEDLLHTCNFKGNKLYADMKTLILLEDNAQNFHLMNSYRKNGFLFYNVRHNSINEYHNKDTIEKAMKYSRDLKMLTLRIKLHMEEFFDDNTVNEFIEYKIEPMVQIFQRVINATNHAQNIRVWKKRPFN